MGILKTDIISHSQLPDGNQSVEFDGTGDYLQVPASEAWDIGRANRPHKAVTIEWWIYLNSLSSHTAFGVNQLSGIVAYGANGRYAVYGGGQTLINESNSVLDAVGLNEWHHYALVLHPGPAGGTKNVEFYRDGKLSVSSTYAANVGLGVDSTILSIGADAANNSGFLNGFISNFRWSQEVVYKSEFTVPKFKLKALPSTMLLCCQSSTSVTEAAVSVTGSVTSNGDPAVSAFGPGLKDDITDTGVVFDGVTTFDSQAYMVPPGGNTRERNRGRAIIAGGTNGSGWGTKLSTISFIQIQSGGITQGFGELSAARTDVSSVSSSTRAVFGGGSVGATSNDAVNILEFVTISTSSIATDFGDLIDLRRPKGGVSNNIRGLFGGGEISPSNKSEIDHVVIATAGNATDFGDLLVSGTPNEGSSNSTRGVWMGGGWGVQIEIVTIASTGSSTDFGNLGNNRGNAAGASSTTRALCAGGGSADTDISFIEFATLGNDSVFGDLTQGRRTQHGTSNALRGIFCGGYTPDYNIIDAVTIATTGNAVDFGDLTTATREPDACSDSHGGVA